MCSCKGSLCSCKGSLCLCKVGLCSCKGSLCGQYRLPKDKFLTIGDTRKKTICYRWWPVRGLCVCWCIVTFYCNIRYPHGNHNAGQVEPVHDTMAASESPPLRPDLELFIYLFI